MSFMDTIYATRKRLGWTQARMAEALGVTARTLIHWEQGRHEPRHAPLIIRRVREIEREQRARKEA